MLKVALTGSIAVGKNYVLSVLAELGCHPIDADQVAHEVTKPGRPAYHEVVQTFGSGILGEGGAIDRARLGALVFDDPVARARLNQIVHPRVIEEINRMIGEIERQDPDGIIMVAAALIVESGAYKTFDKVIVVTCDEETQITRLMGRDAITREAAMKKMEAQLSSADKRRYADYEVDTSGSFDETRAQVEAVYRRLKES
jgi:dephospho-CoA kinase